MPIGLSGVPKGMQSKVVLQDGSAYNSVYVTVTFTGTIRFFVSSNDGTDWVEVQNIVTATQQTVTLSTPGTQVVWKAFLNVGAVITRIVIEKAS